MPEQSDRRCTSDGSNSNPKMWVRAGARGEEEMGIKSCKGSRNGKKAEVDLNHIYCALIKY